MVSPGITQKGDVDAYCKAAADIMVQQVLGVQTFQDQFTACHEGFPQLAAIDKHAICFNVQEGVVPSDTDPYFQWQGTYFQLDCDGCPVDESWRDGLKYIAKDEGVELVKEYCSAKTKLRDGGDQVYYCPAKVRRWGIKGPDPSKPTNMENLLIKRQHQWIHVEVYADEQQQATGKEFRIDDKQLLRRITYLFFFCELNPGKNADVVYGDQDPSEKAWLWGSSLLRLIGTQGESSLRLLHSIPACFGPVRFVPLSSRKAFMNQVASTPTAVITGATLEKDSQFASQFSTEIGREIGHNLAKHADQTGVKVLINGSMKGHSKTMSADEDFAAGFLRHPGCKVVSVKGLNMVQLHGDAWKVESGVGYVLEEELKDFSNNAKEACICAAVLNSKSIVMAANGGPTVSSNLARFLYLSSPERVFAVNGMHSTGGKSGASGSFKTTADTLDQAVGAMKIFAPDFFKDFLKTGEALQQELLKKPLTLLDFNVDGDKRCVRDTYTLKHAEENQKVSPGITNKNDVEAYCEEAVEIMLRQVL